MGIPSTPSNALQLKYFIVWTAVTIGGLLTIHGDLLAQTNATRNSTRKIRMTPSALTKQAGSAVNWEPDFDTAAQKSLETNKPIFWYVPTLRGTFMDRKSEIDRYMLSGPFSWPNIIEVINEHYIPVRSAPTKKQQADYQLVPYEFIEPGFLILKPDGKCETKVDRITTMHPQWFRGLITRSLAQAQPIPTQPKLLATAWKQFKIGDYETAAQTSTLGDNEDTLPPNARCELGLLRGMANFRLGRQEEAKAIWLALSEKFPNEPLAWKAAAEAQGAGPFYRGFEVHTDLPKPAMLAGIKSKGSAAPSNTFTEKELWNHGTNFLLGMQDESGGFTDSDYDFGGTDSLPNVHVAITALAGMAMLEALQRPDCPERLQRRLPAAIKRAIEFTTDDSRINKIDRDEILWAYAFRLRFLSRCLELPKTNLGVPLEELRLSQQKTVELLEGVQSRGGGWYHEYNNPFVTATALVALAEANTLGAKIDSTKIDKGLQSLLSDRFANGAFPYSSGRRKRNNEGTEKDFAASAGRMPLCELGLFVWDKSNDTALNTAVKKSLDFHDNLDIALKYDDHTSTLAYGGFFFWYDMRARSETIRNLTDRNLRKRCAEIQKSLVMNLPELDGCFVDSHELGRVYGTAMALLSLANCNSEDPAQP